MGLSRRKLLSLTGVGASVIGGGILLTDPGDSPFRVKATVGTRPTKDAYLDQQPPLSDGGALWATMLNPGAIMEMDISLFPDHVQERLADTEADTFWVVAGAILPPEIEFSLGRGEFSDDELGYTVTPYEDRVDGERGDLNLNMDSSDHLLYHYKLQQWTATLPWADPPGRVAVNWVADSN